jgi:myo-inositol-1(or 4)-monophosphatase
MIDEGAAIFYNLLNNCAAVRLCGSSLLDMCHLAAGDYDAFAKIKPLYWDIAAGLLIVEEAGGIITDMQGSRWKESEDSLVASNGLCHDSLIEALRK